MEIGKLRSGGLIANYRCSASCAHCLYASGPRREDGYMTPMTAHRILNTIRDRGCSSVHIGGGEPLLYPEELCELLAAADACNIDVEYVETNGSWFRDAATADRLLSRLHEHGLATLLVSMDPFHNAAIPFAKVEGVMAACERVGIGVFPWQAVFADELRQFDTTCCHQLEEFEDRFGTDYVASLFWRYGITFGGRAAMTFREHMPRRPAAEIATEANGCAERLTNTSHFHVDFHGNYIPSLCTGLAVDISHIRKPLDNHCYPILCLLHDQGVEGLLAQAMAEHGFRPDPEGYVNCCDLCLAIRGHLVHKGGALSRDLAPLDFYTELFPAI